MWLHGCNFGLKLLEQTRALLTQPAKIWISNDESTQSNPRKTNIYDLISDQNFKHLAFCFCLILSVLTSVSLSSFSLSLFPLLSLSLSVMDSRSLWCITTGVWSDTKRVKTLAFSSMKRLLLKCEHDVFTTEHWTIRWIGDPFWFLWQYQIELSSA